MYNTKYTIIQYYYTKLIKNICLGVSIKILLFIWHTVIFFTNSTQI